MAERDEKELARRQALASAAREAEQRRLAETAAAAERIAKEDEAAQRVLAETAEKKAVEEAAIAQAVRDFLLEDLLGLAGSARQIAADMQPDPDLKLSTLLDRALVKVEERFTDQPGVRDAVQTALANALESIGRYDEAAQLWEKVRQYREETLGAEHADTLISMSNLAVAYQAAGESVRALPLLEQTLELMKSTLGPEQRNTLISMNNLAVAYQDAGDSAGALSLYEQTLEIQKARLGPEHPDTLTSMNNLAGAYLNAGALAKALPLQEQTLELLKARSGPEHPVTLTSMNNLAGAYGDVDDHSRALDIAELALSLQRLRSPVEPADRHLRANFLLSASRSLTKLNRCEEAEAAAREAVTIRHELMPDKWEYFIALGYLGESLLGQGRYAEAEKPLVERYEGFKKQFNLIPATRRDQFLRKANQRLVSLYELWDKPEEVARWQTDLEQFLAELKDKKQPDRQ